VHRVAYPGLLKLLVQPTLVLGEPFVVDHPNLEDRRYRRVLRERERPRRGLAEPHLVDRWQAHVPGNLRGDVDRRRRVLDRDREGALDITLEVVDRRGVDLPRTAADVVQQGVFAVPLVFDARQDAGRQDRTEQSQDLQDIDPGCVAVLVANDPAGLRRRDAGLVGHLRRARLHGHLGAGEGIEDELVVVEVLRNRARGEAVELLLQVRVADVGNGRELKLIDRDGLDRHGGDDPERTEADHGRIEHIIVAHQPGTDPLDELVVHDRSRLSFDPERLADAGRQVQAGDEVGHRPVGELRSVGVAGDGSRDRLAVADPRGLDRPPVGLSRRKELEVGVELGDLHARLGADEVAVPLRRVRGIEVPVADVVTAVQQLGVHQPAIGDVDLRQRPSRADREDSLAGVVGLADQVVEVLAGVPEHLPPGERLPVGTDVVRVVDLGHRRAVGYVDARPRLGTFVFGVDHGQALSPGVRIGSAGGSHAS